MCCWDLNDDTGILVIQYMQWESRHARFANLRRDLMLSRELMHTPEDHHNALNDVIRSWAPMTGPRIGLSKQKLVNVAIEKQVTPFDDYSGFLSHSVNDGALSASIYAYDQGMRLSDPGLIRRCVSDLSPQSSTLS